MSHVSTIISMLFLGLTGCCHCLAMCGPIIFAFPGKSEKTGGHLLFHTGRIFSYILSGTMVSVIGNYILISSNDKLFSIPQIQIILSIFSSTLLIFFGFIKIGIIGEPKWITSNTFGILSIFIKRIVKGNKNNNASFLFTMGFATGFLPCGLSYAAFTSMLPIENTLSAPLYMLSFGLGTLPSLFFAGKGASSLIRRYRKETDLFSGILIIGMALSLLSKSFQTLAP